MTVDSGAEENVCPWDWGSQFPVTGMGNVLNFRGASGEVIDHYGQRDVYVNSPF